MSFLHDIWNPWHGCVKCSEAKPAVFARLLQAPFLMPWIIGIVAEKAGLAAGMASNIVPCVGLIIFTLLVAKLPEE